MSDPQDSPRIAVWNAYHNMAEVLCIEDGDSWQEIRLTDLVRLFRDEFLRDFEERRNRDLGWATKADT